MAKKMTATSCVRRLENRNMGQDALCGRIIGGGAPVGQSYFAPSWPAFLKRLPNGALFVELTAHDLQK
jgi:hypothetical protein